MVVALGVLHHVLQYLYAYLFLVAFPLLIFLWLVLFLAAAALETHARGVAQLVIQGHLGCLVTPLATLAALGTLPLDLLLGLSLHLLVVREETIVIDFIQLHFRQIFL